MAFRWLAFSRVLQLQEELASFLSSHKHPLARKFCDDCFSAKLAFLVDLLLALNSLNVSLQGEDITVLNSMEKIEAFLLKVELWIRRCEKDSFDHFPELHKRLQTKAGKCSFKS